MRTWGMLPAVVAPVVLIGGAMLARSRQPSGYSPVHNSISEMASRTAPDDWIMTSVFAITGLCFVASAIYLTGAGVLGQTLLALGGVATIVVAASPQPSADHVPAAGVAFVAMALWPAVSGVPSGAARVAATLVLLLLLGWFGLQLAGGWLGLTERLLAGAEALWPLVVTVMVIRRARAAPADGGDAPTMG